MKKNFREMPAAPKLREALSKFGAKYKMVHGEGVGVHGEAVSTFDTTEEVCFLCGKVDGDDMEVGNDGEPTSETVNLTKCKFCKRVWFCKRAHMEIHRPRDKCFPFVIKRSPKKGR